MKPDINWLPAVLCLFFLSLHADAQNAFPVEAARLSHVMHDGDFESVIAQTTEIMGRSGTLEETLTYLRDKAEWHLCWFGAAYNNLTPLIHFPPHPTSLPPSSIVTK